MKKVLYVNSYKHGDGANYGVMSGTFNVVRTCKPTSAKIANINASLHRIIVNVFFFLSSSHRSKNVKEDMHREFFSDFSFFVQNFD
jgi:hypothetical protein